MKLRRTFALVSLVAVIAASLPMGAAGAEINAAVDDRQAIGMRTALALVPVSFTFATREEGHELLLTDVHVVVVCPVAGKVFEGVSEGPFLIANVSDGRYEVIASHEGRAQRVALTITRGEPRRVSIYW